MSKRVRKIALYFFAGFVIFFSFRFIYSKSDRAIYDEEEGVFDLFEDGSFSRKNYASDSYKFKNEKALGTEASVVSVDQKYEKIASIGSKAEQFDENERQVRSTLKTYNTVIQYEQKTGNKGNRNLLLLIGVKPERFDSLYEKLKAFGKNKKAEITKTDKTNEFRAINARKRSLEKTRDALVALKSQSGKIEEYIVLEEKIRDIEDTLQVLGVSLGDFDLENEFCTIRYSLSESRPKVAMSFLHRAKVSLEWTIEYYFMFIMLVLLVFLSSFILVLLIDKLKILQAILKNKF